MRSSYLFTEDGLTEMEKINKYYAMRTLQDEIRVQKKNFSYLDGMAVFSTYSKLITGVYGSLDKEKIEDFVWKLCEDDSILAYQKKWKAVAFGGEYYLVTVRSDGTKHAIAWIKASELLNIEAKGEMKSICGIYMQNEENDLLGAVKYTDDFQALRCIQGKSENILLSEKSKKGEITICMETASANIFAGMTGIQILLLLIAFGCMAIVPILHRVLTRNVTVPIEELIHSMNVFENGNTEAFVDTENKTLEFEKLGNSFNSMIA